ncbi:MAG: divalent-cation tolerance protein CutA [Saprospiraceae bacterium]|uniref:Divalent-cation tolerance protein CutA n=1 Tax=Candidatus Opimibacter skivensis TaxID=2982028 RepID=A0A9D7XRL6_9BACT|nr:divalent-cation tolerance protein CutA [Candidatus Opimibacter skivensis]
MQILLFYIPTASKTEAISLGEKAIENRIAACSNIFPIQSIFPWEGTIQNENEFVLVLKTIPSLKNQLTSFITSLHSYEVPCILSWIVEVNESYGMWIKENVLKENSH